MTAYARLYGYSADEFAALKLAAIKRAEDVFLGHQEGIGGQPISRLEIETNLAPADALILLQRRAAKSRTGWLAATVSRHIKEHKSLYSVDWNELQKRARQAGIDSSDTDWLLHFLQEIPTIRPFSPDTDAFVRLFPEGAPSVVLSADLDDLLQVALVPLLMNVLSDDGAAMPLKRRNMTAELVGIVVDAVVAAINTYTHKDINALTEWFDPKHENHWLFRHTQVVDTIGTLLVFGAIDFVWFHELAHVVLGHTGIERKRHEIEADNFAINCIVDDCRRRDGSDMLTSFEAAGVCLLLSFFEVLEAMTGYQVSDTHPPPIARRAALAMAVLGGLEAQFLPNYQGLAQMIALVTGATCCRFMPSANEAVTVGMADMQGFQVAVIPLDKPPYIEVVSRR